MPYRPCFPVVEEEQKQVAVHRFQKTAVDFQRLEPLKQRRMFAAQNIPVIEAVKNPNGSAVRVAGKRPAVKSRPLVIISGGLAGLFLLLFLLRLLYLHFLVGMVNKPSVNEDFFSTVENLPKNYASVKSVSGEEDNPDAEQKIEKVAFVKTITPSLEFEEALLKKTISRTRALVRYEKKTGVIYNRQSHYLIAVKPVFFDSFYSVVQGMGQPAEREITSVDRTNEYRRLRTKRASLEQSLRALTKLKNAVQPNTDLDIPYEIAKTQTGLQETETDLVSFEPGHDYCSIRISMYETTTNKSTGLWTVLHSAWQWSVKYYPFVALCALAFLLYKRLEKTKLPDLFTGATKA